jgi:hypothetical protein
LIEKRITFLLPKYFAAFSGIKVPTHNRKHSDAAVHYYQPARRHIEEDIKLHGRKCENFKALETKCRRMPQILAQNSMR